MDKYMRRLPDKFTPGRKIFYPSSHLDFPIGEELVGNAIKFNDSYVVKLPVNTESPYEYERMLLDKEIHRLGHDGKLSFRKPY